MEVLNLDGGRTLSPKDLSLELQAPLSTINYHVTELVCAELLTLVGERQVRGAIEHFYRPVDSAKPAPKRSSGKRTKKDTKKR